VQVPVFVTCRDRLAPLRELVAWLERAGCDEIYLLDNDSAYEPLLDWYEQTPHTVVRLGRNYRERALWEAPGVFELTRGRRFVHSDPDIVPDPACPLDAIERFGALLERFPAVNKAGFGLRIDDLPDHYAHKQAVLLWEAQEWRYPVGHGAYFAAIDSTFALHRRGAGLRPADAIRTGPPYVARHTDWYLDLDDPGEEHAYYLARGNARNWGAVELPDWLGQATAELAANPPSRLRLAYLRLRVLARLRRPLVRGRAGRRREPER
jgi:hypothetical protein